jgi:hypothetical protein
MHMACFVENPTVDARKYNYMITHLVPGAGTGGQIRVEADDSLEKLQEVIARWSMPRGSEDVEWFFGERTVIDPAITPLTQFREQVMGMVCDESGSVKPFEMPCMDSPSRPEWQRALECMIPTQAPGIVSACVAPGQGEEAIRYLAAYDSMNCKRFGTILSVFFQIPMPQAFIDMQELVDRALRQVGRRSIGSPLME